MNQVTDVPFARLVILSCMPWLAHLRQSAISSSRFMSAALWYLMFWPFLAAQAASSPFAGNCVDCHTKLGPTMVEAWKSSAHAVKGVGCVECHGADHSTIFSRKGRVSAAVCGKCHEKEQKEFQNSLHASAVDLMIVDPKFSKLPKVISDLGCSTCHQIGAKHEDGSKGNCNSCHSSHKFSVQEARRPEACAACHTGPDHPHMAMWQASKHGQLFASADTQSQSPTCVTCHMPGGSHDTSLGISYGQVSNGAHPEGSDPPVKMRAISTEMARKQRMKMLETCAPCHSSRFASESLAKADEVKREVDELLRQAVRVIQNLEKDGLLVRPGGGLLGIEPGHSLVLGADQLYDGLSPVEQRFFDMAKFHHASAFKGAYHQSPEFTHNQGYLRMRQDLTFILSEAEKLREKKQFTPNPARVAEPTPNTP